MPTYTINATYWAPHYVTREVEGQASPEEALLEAQRRHDESQWTWEDEEIDFDSASATFFELTAVDGQGAAFPWLTLGENMLGKPDIQATRAQVMRDPAASDWLKAALVDSRRRDVLDALRDAEVLAAVLRGEFDADTSS